MARKIKLVLGVIGSDCHAVGNKILDYSLTEAGFEVTNIGVLSPQEDFINAALETNADAILVSSLYGQGELDCKGLRMRYINVLPQWVLITFIRREHRSKRLLKIYMLIFPIMHRT